MPTSKSGSAVARMIGLIGSGAIEPDVYRGGAGGRMRLCHRLEFLALYRKRLREERRRGLLGSWSYDLARHEHMLALYREMALEALGEHLRKKACASSDRWTRSSQ